MPVPQNILFKLSKAVHGTSLPPYASVVASEYPFLTYHWHYRHSIPQAYKWAASYVPTTTRPILDMSQGVPGIPPPKSVLDALGKFSSDPKSCGYCPMTGEQSLRESLAKEMKHVYGSDADISGDDVALTAGCNMAFVTVVMSLAESGDEIILPVPWYFNHQMTLQMLGITTVPLPTYSKEGFQPSPELCEKLITPRTKAIVLVSPNNPTGAVYKPSLIASFASLSKRHGVALVIDETYRDFIANDVPHHLFAPGHLQKGEYRRAILPEDWSWRSTFIHLFSFSKSYCVPGHRLGAIVAPSDVLDQVKTVLDCLQICPPRPIQLALQSSLPDLRPFIRKNAEALAHRHELFRSLLPSTWKIGSQGAYYAFVRHPFLNVSATEVCRRMATEAGIVTLPAAFFSPEALCEIDQADNHDRWVRFSVANVDDERIKAVCRRLSEIEGMFGWKVDAD